MVDRIACFSIFVTRVTGALMDFENPLRCTQSGELLYYNTVAYIGSFKLLTGIQFGGPTVLQYSDGLRAQQMIQFDYIMCMQCSSLLSIIMASLFLLNGENLHGALV